MSYDCGPDRERGVENHSELASLLHTVLIGWLVVTLVPERVLRVVGFSLAGVFWCFVAAIAAAGSRTPIDWLIDVWLWIFALGSFVAAFERT